MILFYLNHQYSGLGLLYEEDSFFAEIIALSDIKKEAINHKMEISYQWPFIV